MKDPNNREFRPKVNETLMHPNLVHQSPQEVKALPLDSGAQHLAHKMSTDDESHTIKPN